MIINLPMKSYRFPQIPLLAVTLCLLPPSAHARQKKAPPVKPAGQYAAFDTHPNEKVTVAAEPCNDPKVCDFFRLPYIQHGFIPIRVVFTNDGDTALSLDDARIQFISANNDVIPAATLDDIHRRLFAYNANRTHIPMPAPIPNITVTHPPVDKKITEDDSDFGFSGTVVNAHSTLGGYLFYDVRGLDDLPLKNASLYIKEVWTLNRKKQLFSFTIPLNKWLATQSSTQSSTKTTAKPDADSSH
jgi:hypothetical protein